MAFVMDRALQRELLERMREVYPGTITSFGGHREISGAPAASVAYLAEHGLCEVSAWGNDKRQFLTWAKITARGLDFLADDGGLSAILGVVTVKLHADTIRDLITAKIEASGLPEPKKSALRAALAKLPAVVLQEGSKRLMGLGAEHVGDIEGWLHGLAGLFGQ